MDRFKFWIQIDFGLGLGLGPHPDLVYTFFFGEKPDYAIKIHI